MKKFKKADWKSMRIISEPEAKRGQVRADRDGTMWLWARSDGNGSVWATILCRIQGEEIT